ncbi:MAG: peptide chain release factor 2 [Anaeroplasmataceae bacterium]|nr:peptide chain release factor 2 [Anaeroplasmataceae bacterium]
MEKYELNKFINEYQQKLLELKQALGVEGKRPVLKELEQQISASDFWEDQIKAQSIISQMNLLKETLSNYDNLDVKFKEILDFVDMALEDVEAMELLEAMIDEFKIETAHLEEQALLSGKYDSVDCILELHPGAGGTESMDWADMLYRMYSRFCSKKGFKLTVLDYLPGDEAGIKSVTLSISGPFAYGLFKAERGVHRLVRISPFDSNARRHTSFVSCDVSPQMPETDEVIIKDEDIKIDVYHSSGAGGQSVNTTDSAVRITHKPTGIVVTCQNERSQIKNREVAMRVLKSKLLELEIKRQEEEMKNLKGSQMEINFGSQIRSYVFCPYTLVKDHRTGYEMGNITAVMDGDIEGFMLSYLRMMAGKENEMGNH